MNDWLSEIERDCEFNITYNKRYGLRTNSMFFKAERMARVLRELAGCFESFHDIPGGNPAFSTSALFDAYNNLSDDAKELLK